MNDLNIKNFILGRHEEGAEELVRSYGPLIRYIIKPIVQNPEDIEDCMQDVYVTLLDRIGSYDEKRGSLRAWIAAVSRNSALNYVKKHRQTSDIDELSDDSGYSDDPPEKCIEQKELSEALIKAVGSLKKHERTLFLRKYYFRQSTRQIAAELEMTEKAVEAKLRRTRNKLREILRGEGFE